MRLGFFDAVVRSVRIARCCCQGFLAFMYLIGKFFGDNVVTDNIFPEQSLSCGYCQWVKNI